MKKLIFAMTCISLIFSLSSLCCFAQDSRDASLATEDITPVLCANEDYEETADIALSTDSDSAEDSAQKEDTENPDLKAENSPDSNADIPQKDDTGADENANADINENPFEVLYNLALEHSGEIFSALACIFSAVLMLCFRKGIMPIIRGGIGAISGSVSTISRESEKQSMLSEGTKAVIEGKLACAEELLSKISKSFDDYEKRLQTCEGVKAFENNVRIILLSQIDLLYEVFMNSSLPQYEKDKIGEMVNAMKKTAREGSEEA